MRVHLFTALAVSIPVGLITAFLMTVALRARRNKLVSGADGLIGEVGVARTPFTQKERSSSTESSGMRFRQPRYRRERAVVVRRVEGLQLAVAPSSEAARVELATPV